MAKFACTLLRWSATAALTAAAVSAGSLRASAQDNSVPSCYGPHPATESELNAPLKGIYPNATE